MSKYRTGYRTDALFTYELYLSNENVGFISDLVHYEKVTATLSVDDSSLDKYHLDFVRNMVNERALDEARKVKRTYETVGRGYRFVYIEINGELIQM